MADKRTGIEPHRMSVPTMDRPSVTFAWMLDSMVVDGEPDGLLLVCKACGDPVCAIDRDDTLRVLFNTALAHTCV